MKAFKLHIVYDSIPNEVAVLSDSKSAKLVWTNSSDWPSIPISLKSKELKANENSNYLLETLKPKVSEFPSKYFKTYISLISEDGFPFCIGSNTPDFSFTNEEIDSEKEKLCLIYDPVAFQNLSLSKLVSVTQSSGLIPYGTPFIFSGDFFFAKILGDYLLTLNSSSDNFGVYDLIDLRIFDKTHDFYQTVKTPAETSESPYAGLYFDGWITGKNNSNSLV